MPESPSLNECPTGSWDSLEFQGFTSCGDSPAYIPDYPDLDALDLQISRYLKELEEANLSQTQEMLKQLEVVILNSHKNSALFKTARGNGVRHTEEFERIKNLPRRTWVDEKGDYTQEALDLADKLTEVLKTPTGTMKLRPVQAVAIWEFCNYGYIMGPMRAGSGKTLVTLILPALFNLSPAVLLLPAKLIKKTQRDMVELSKHWKIAYWLHLMSYEKLSRKGQADWLTKLKPRIVVADEAHKLKNPKAACTKRVKRECEVKTDKPFFCPFSGTFTKRSMQDYAHLAKWSMGPGAPVPNRWGEVENWGNALDEKPRSTFRTPPGVLVEFSNGNPDLAAVREGFGRRCAETPGWVSTYDKGPDCTLIIQRASCPLPEEVLAAFKRLRDEGQTPDGWPLLGGLDEARHAKEIALGFYYRWNPRGPADWMAARSAYASFVRYVLQNNRSNLDTELQVRLAYPQLDLFRERWVEKKGIQDYFESPLLGRPLNLQHPLESWEAIKKLFTPNKEAIWIGAHALEFCANWLKEPGIVWCEHVDFAVALSKITGVPYCGAGGETKDGRDIESFQGAPIIASLQSSGEGRNLQKWNRALVTSPSGSGQLNEQLLARMHRDGTDWDEVTFEYLSLCKENERAWFQACADAEHIARTSLQPQRLGYATVDWPGAPLSEEGQPNWDDWECMAA